ncbi:MAG TPA: VOC family protein [Methylibium sp.]|uniref:VOC family protein n=1 Tax=Methylibium sp. TaxID=2067992 RepID=UPI002DBA12FF|nr:VOC family protein [Methylibium sp.]HEU4457757.1 VOC family protein [Methylibium sp.]
MDPFQTHGAFSWSELTTADPAAAADFYAKLLGWSFDAMEITGSTYRVIKVGETAIGGIMSSPPGAPAMPPSWGSYVSVDDLDARVEAVPKLGGRVHLPPTPIPGVGRFAVIADPDGALLSLITYDPPTGE